MKRFISSFYVSLLLAAGASAAEPATATVDSITFGDASSEQTHGMEGTASEAFEGTLGQPARRLLEGGAFPWQGGNARFKMKVDAGKQNYVTVKFWGSDLNENRLVLLCDGKQIGYRHLGDIDILDSPNGSPEKAGCFFYVTSPLPLAITKGKAEVQLEVFATGRIWGYGTTFGQYQKPMAGVSRGLYRAYTHTDGCFTPSPEEAHGAAPLNPPVRKEPGAEVLEQLKERVNKTIAGMIASKNPLTQHELWFLSKAYNVKWTPVYRDAGLVKKVVAGLDVLYCSYRQNPEIVHGEKSIYNAGWFGLGPAANAVVLLAEPMAPYIDQEIEGAKGTTRREGWSEFPSDRPGRWAVTFRQRFFPWELREDRGAFWTSDRAARPRPGRPEGPEAGAEHR